MADAEILIADVGGTNARIGHLREAWQPGRRLADADLLRLGSSTFTTFEDFVDAALEQLGIDNSRGMDAVFSVAGPVVGGRVQLTNLDWAPADEAALEKRFSFRRCRLVNDLVAATWGVTGLGTSLVAGQQMQAGTSDASSRKMLLNVGTGLGVAYWSGEGEQFRVEGSEAGHAGFAPPADAMDLMAFMQSRYGRVSWERILAGSALSELHHYYAGEAVDQSSAVVTLAQRGEAAALDTIARFSRLLGVCAGDLALSAPALGGVWLTGGVVGGLGQLLDVDQFLEGFLDKGRMQPLLRRVPVFKITEQGLGLIGAWRIAGTSTTTP